MIAAPAGLIHREAVGDFVPEPQTSYEEDDVVRVPRHERVPHWSVEQWIVGIRESKGRTRSIEEQKEYSDGTRAKQEENHGWGGDFYPTRDDFYTTRHLTVD